MRPGTLERTLSEVRLIQADIRAGLVPDVALEEFVETAYSNSQIHTGLSGTGLGADYACDRLPFKGIGTRAVNLALSGSYRTWIIESANWACTQELSSLYQPNQDI